MPRNNASLTEAEQLACCRVESVGAEAHARARCSICWYATGNSSLLVELPTGHSWKHCGAAHLQHAPDARHGACAAYLVQGLKSQLASLAEQYYLKDLLLFSPAKVHFGFCLPLCAPRSALPLGDRC